MAVDFNPQIQELGNRDWSGASRGTGPNRSFEALFGGIAETAMGVIQNRDAQVQENIETDAREGFESTNTEFGFDPPPSGMQGELDRIVSLQNALDQGKISQVNYYGRLATLSKQLRTKYPRYESIVDQTIQSITGTRPANAYRDALLSEIDSLSQGASDEAKFRRQYEKDNEGVIANIFGPEYFEDPSKYDLREVQSRVSSFKGEIEGIEAELKRLQRNAEVGDVNKEQAKRNANRSFSFSVTSALDKTANGVGFNDMITQFISGGGENLDEFTIQIAQTEAQIRASLTTLGMEQYVTTGLLSQQEVNEAIDSAMFPISAAKEQILGGNFEFAGRITTINNDTKQRGLKEIFDKYPNARIGAGISEFNPYAGAEWLTRTGTLDQIGNIATEISGQAASGNAGEILKDTVESGDQKVTRATIDTFFNVVTDPNVTQTHVSNLVDQLFGTSIDFMSSEIVDPSDLEAVYTKFLDPAVTKAIVEKGAPEDLQKYTAWALEKFRALPNVRSAAGNVNKALKGVNPEDLNISYNPQTNRMEFKINNPDVLKGDPGSFDLTTPLLPSFIGSFNKALAVLDPIVEASGGTMEAIVPDLLQEMNRLEEGGRNDGFFKWLGDKISMGEAEGTEIASVVSEDTDLDFMFEQKFEEVGRGPTPTNESRVADASDRTILDGIGVAEGAGYNTLFGQSQRRYGVTPTSMTIGEIRTLQRRMSGQLGSSAAGKYQIMAGTLRDAISAMGLTDDMVFDEELQDRIALEFLLPRRGYNEWKAGKIDNRTFLRNMSQEWAAIPTTLGGQSFYEGDRMGNTSTRGGQALAQTLLSR